jgi:hypothetical protein
MTTLAVGKFEIHVYQQCGGLFCATGWLNGSLLWNVEGKTFSEAAAKARAKAEAQP